MIRRSGDWISAEVGTERVMMSVADGRYIALGGVGGHIWDLLEQPYDAEALCAQLTAAFEVDDATCRTEVAAFLAELRKHGAIVE